MAALDDPRGIKRLRSLLYDNGGRRPRRRLHGAGAHPRGRPAAGRRVGPERRARGRAPPRPAGADRRRPQGAAPKRRRARLAAARPRAQRQLRRRPHRGVQGGAQPADRRRRGRARSASSLQSVHADVRREVLTEVMAQVERAVGVGPAAGVLQRPRPELRERGVRVRRQEDEGAGAAGGGAAARSTPTCASRRSTG